MANDMDLIEQIDSEAAVAFRQKWEPRPGDTYRYLVAIVGYQTAVGKGDKQRQEYRFIVAVRRYQSCAPGESGDEQPKDLAIVDVDAEALESYKRFCVEFRKRYGATYFDDDVVARGAVKAWPEALDGLAVADWKSFMRHPGLKPFL